MDKEKVKEIYALVRRMTYAEKALAYLFIARDLKCRELEGVETILETPSKRLRLVANVDFIEEYR